MIEARDDLLDADRSDVQFRHIGRQVCIAFVSADHECPGLGDREIAAGHAGVGREYQRACRFALRFRQVMNIAVGRVGADCPGEHLRHVGPELVDCRHHDVARVFIVELLDALAKVGLDDLDPDRRHVRTETALLGQHRLALDQRRGAVVVENSVDDLIVLGGVARPMDIDAVRPGIGFELFQVLVEMGKRVLLDRRGEGAQLLPFGNGMHLAVALLSQIPKPLVVHLLVLGRGNETRGGFRLVDRPIAVHLGAARLRLRPRTQWLRGRLRVIEVMAVTGDAWHIGIQQLRMQQGRRGVHAVAPRRKNSVGVAGSDSRGIYASLSKLRPPGPKAMT